MSAFFKFLFVDGIISKKIFILNFLIIIIKSLVYILEILGLSTLVLFLLDYLSEKTVQNNLIQSFFDLSFLHANLSVINIFNILLIIFSLRFLLMISFSYLLEKNKKYYLSILFRKIYKLYF